MPSRTVLTPTASTTPCFAARSPAFVSGARSAGRSPAGSARTITISPWRVTVSGSRRPRSAVASVRAARGSAPASSGTFVGTATTSAQRASGSSPRLARGRESGRGLRAPDAEQVLEQVAVDPVGVRLQQLLGIEVGGAGACRDEVDVVDHGTGRRERLLCRGAARAGRAEDRIPEDRVVGPERGEEVRERDALARPARGVAFDEGEFARLHGATLAQDVAQKVVVLLDVPARVLDHRGAGVTVRGDTGDETVDDGGHKRLSTGLQRVRDHVRRGDGCHTPIVIGSQRRPPSLVLTPHDLAATQP